MTTNRDCLFGCHCSGEESVLEPANLFGRFRGQTSCLCLTSLLEPPPELGFGVVEKATHENLAKLRTHQIVDQHEMDKDVKAATANPPTQAGPPPKDDKGAKGGKTGKTGK